MGESGYFFQISHCRVCEVQEDLTGEVLMVLQGRARSRRALEGVYTRLSYGLLQLCPRLSWIPEAQSTMYRKGGHRLAANSGRRVMLAGDWWKSISLQQETFL